MFPSPNRLSYNKIVFWFSLTLFVAGLKIYDNHHRAGLLNKFEGTIKDHLDYFQVGLTEIANRKSKKFGSVWRPF